ncbi:MAG: hypothetical protein AB4372_36605 [Xenococcus sp. (in: cyanobacteria)]
MSEWHARRSPLVRALASKRTTMYALPRAERCNNFIWFTLVPGDNVAIASGVPSFLVENC